MPRPFSFATVLTMTDRAAGTCPGEVPPPPPPRSGPGSRQREPGVARLPQLAKRMRGPLSVAEGMPGILPRGPVFRRPGMTFMPQDDGRAPPCCRSSVAGSRARRRRQVPAASLPLVRNAFTAARRRCGNRAGAARRPRAGPSGVAALHRGLSAIFDIVAPLPRLLRARGRPCGCAGSASASARMIRLDHVCGLFRDHDRGRIRVGGYQPRHDRGVDDPEAVDAVESQARRDDRIRVRSHPACA